MTSQPQLWRLERERDFLESLRVQYEDQGFDFTIHPDSAAVPRFFESYIPDALAQRRGLNIAIEVKDRQASPKDRALTDIKRLLDGHPDWRLNVHVMGDPLQLLHVPVASPSAVRDRVGEIRQLITEGHSRPAFVMAWSLLEAALRARDGEAMDSAHTPGTVVQSLAMNGFIEPDLERRLRGLIPARNQIVHGDVGAEPSIADVELVLSAIEDTLSAEAA
jgi:hypothetical protein